MRVRVVATVRRSVVVGAVAAVGLTACTTTTGRAEPPAAPAVTAPVTTVAPVASRAPDGPEAAPPVLDTGTDPDLPAVARSLMARAEWISAQRPEPAALADVVFARSAYERASTAAVAALAAEGRREVVSRPAPPEVTLIDHHIDNLATLRWVEAGVTRTVVDAEGRAVRVTTAPPSNGLVLLHRLDSGQWRISDFQERFWH